MGNENILGALNCNVFENGCIFNFQPLIKELNGSLTNMMLKWIIVKKINR